MRLKQIPLSAQLLDLKEASQKLTEQFGKGYSDRAIRRLVNSGEWQENWHYVRLKRLIKIYLPAVQEWQLRE